MKTKLLLLLTGAALIVALAFGARDGRTETKNLAQATVCGRLLLVHRSPVR